MLCGGWLGAGSGARLTYGNIGVYRPELFSGCRVEQRPLLPILRDAIGRGAVSGEHYLGRWINVGTPADLETLEGVLRSSPSRRVP